MEPHEARDRLAEAICLFQNEIRPATREALVDAAVQALVAGLESPALAELAGRYPDDPWSVLGQTADAVVHELDLRVPTPDQMNVIQLRRQLEALLAGTLTPRELTAWAHSEFGHDGIDAAQPFVAADDEYDSIEYSGQTSDELDAWVRDQARTVLESIEAEPDAEPSETWPLKVVRGDGVEEVWTLTVVEHDRDCLLRLENPGGSIWEVTDGDVWHALRALRSILDPLGVRLCCQGARVDAHVSGMSGSMSGGWLAYILRSWRAPRSRDLVNILDRAPLRKIGTVSEQDLYFERWLKRTWTRIV
ncbi:hypothetical protein [Promicromonospora soli]